MAAQLHPLFGAPSWPPPLPFGEYGLQCNPGWHSQAAQQEAVNPKSTTLSGGSLGSCIDEERSQLR